MFVGIFPHLLHGSRLHRRNPQKVRARVSGPQAHRYLPQSGPKTQRIASAIFLLALGEASLGQVGFRLFLLFSPLPPVSQLLAALLVGLQGRSQAVSHPQGYRQAGARNPNYSNLVEPLSAGPIIEYQ